MLLIEKDKKTRTVVVCPVLKTDFALSYEEIISLENEAKGLIMAMGQDPVFVCSYKLSKIVPKTYLGKGLVENLKEKCLEYGAELLVIDTPITPVQQRNLEKELNIKVIDRTAVILEIFGCRAQTKEGKLQVELAHLTYQRGRLVRSWTHLERQRGGGGFLGGPGETQIELDRRHIDTRILKIKKELDKVKKTRGIQRASRIRVPFDVVSLVGYTNAGKSTLFNYITKENVFAKDMLFATLDPTMRKIKLSSKNEVILSDTVGFISNLPHELVMAFRATLEEVLEANIILHVIDVSNPNYKEQRKDVLNVLHELGLDKIEYQDNYIEVYNKIDLLSEERQNYFKEKNIKNNVMISAVNGKGVDELLNILDDKTSNKSEVVDFEIDISNGKEMAKIYREMIVLDRTDDLNAGKIYIKARKIIK